MIRLLALIAIAFLISLALQRISRWYVAGMARKAPRPSATAGGELLVRCPTCEARIPASRVVPAGRIPRIGQPARAGAGYCSAECAERAAGGSDDG